MDAAKREENGHVMNMIQEEIRLLLSETILIFLLYLGTEYGPLCAPWKPPQMLSYKQNVGCEGSFTIPLYLP